MFCARSAGPRASPRQGVSRGGEGGALPAAAGCSRSSSWQYGAASSTEPCTAHCLHWPWAGTRCGPACYCPPLLPWRGAVAALFSWACYCCCAVQLGLRPPSSLAVSCV